MQEYLWKSTFREKADSAGFAFLCLCLCLGWFVMLWGVRLQAVCAGLSLFVMCLILRRKTRDRRLSRKEERLRRQLGGEMYLEGLLMQPLQKACFELALLLSREEGFELLRMTDEGVLCRQKETFFLLSFFRLPACETVTPRDVLPLRRAALTEKAREVWLCVPCEINTDVRKTEETFPPLRFIERDRIIRLLGAAHPATDRQLVELGRQKKQKKPWKPLLRAIFHPARTKRYALYGGLLLFLYALTGLFYYAVPGLICVFLAAAGHCFRR